MSGKLSFLSPDRAQIRHQINGILESYSHEWDILAELSQNAVDAVVRAETTRGHIELTVDATQKTIGIKDNGVGIDPSQLQRLLRPFGSDKAGLTNQIGKKGVGLTFVLFSSSSFEIETHSAAGSMVAKVFGARAWVESEEETDLYIDVENIAASTFGTNIKIRLSDNDATIFCRTFEQIVFALRTRTALGSTNFIWG